MDWKNRRENAYPSIILSDCIVDEVYLHDNNLIINFLKHGFVIRENDNSPYYHTKSAQIIMNGCDIDNVSIQMICNKKRLGGKVVRVMQDVELDKFLENISIGKWKFEFVEEYYSQLGGLFVGMIKESKQSMWCYIKMQFASMTCFWDEIDYDSLVQ